MQQCHIHALSSGPTKSFIFSTIPLISVIRNNRVPLKSSSDSIFRRQINRGIRIRRADQMIPFGRNYAWHPIYVDFFTFIRHHKWQYETIIVLMAEFRWFYYDGAE